MNRRNLIILVLAGIGAGAAPAWPQGAPFYNVDKEVRIEATVREISFEPKYKGTAPFLVLRVEENGGGRRFEVEIAPSWFFGQDIHAGEKIKVVGSLNEKAGGTATIIARELQLRGETFTLRDKHGFPSWQGGPQRKRGIRRFGRP
jgi:hypothetical protein